MANASVEFDIETLSPTYKLGIGLPGRSNALAIAQRLGLPASIVAQAETLVSPQSMEVESMLAEIKRSRETTLTAESDAKANLRRAEAFRRGPAISAWRASKRRAGPCWMRPGRWRRPNLRSSRGDRTDAGTIGGVAPVEAEPRGTSRHETWLAEAESILARRAEQVRPLPRAKAAEPLVVDGPLLPGDRVWVPSLQASGEVAAVGPNDVEVKIGSFRVKLGQNRVELQQRGELPAVQASGVMPKPASPGMELDLRGLTVDDMLMELDRYLDTAYLAGLPFVRLIHGKGTGALRQAVREQLRGHPLVSEFRAGDNSEGGEGVTVAKLVQR